MNEPTTDRGRALREAALLVLQSQQIAMRKRPLALATALDALREALAATPEPTLDEWMIGVVLAWREHWEGSEHRYGQDFAAFLGERLMTDFNLRGHEPYPFGHARPPRGAER